MKMQNFKTIMATIFTVSLALVIYHHFFNAKTEAIKIEHINGVPSTPALYSIDDNGVATPLQFTNTAEKVLPTVVHIKATISGKTEMRQPENMDQIPEPFRDFFRERDGDFYNPFFRFDNPNGHIPQNQLRVATGSGVIVNEKGYIVTNNHVINNADDLEVTLHDNRTFKAVVIGTDPTTDLALIQIKANQLSVLPFVNSDDIKIGEWVLAVGNPMGLNSTVTAGIVSAKGRSINILKEKFAVESFIQTDAAINPGNSGGALVNLNGGLIGINTAIASPTGTYAGYGFAVPANIVKKVVEDFITYGAVQRGVLGIMIRTVDGNLAKSKNLSVNEGVIVDSLLDVSAAAGAGIRIGDVIIAVNGNKVKSSPELQARIAQYRPGDKVNLTIIRKGSEKEFEVKLISQDGNTEIAEGDFNEIRSILGAEFKAIDKRKAKSLGINGGVEISKLFAGKLRRETNIKEGFIITKVDGEEVQDRKELLKILEQKKGGVMLEGIYEDIPGVHYYAFGIGA